MKTFQKFKKLISMVLALMLMTFAIIPTGAVTSSQTLSSSSRLSETIQQELGILFDDVSAYLTNQYKTNFSTFFSSDSTGVYNAYFFIKSLQFQKQADKYDGAGYEWYQTDIEIFDIINVSRDHINVTAKIDPTWKYQNLNVSSASNLNYQIGFVKENNEWKIQTIYSADIQFFVSHYGDIDINITDIMNASAELEQNFAEIGREEYREMMSLVVPSLRYTIFINTTNLVSYARTYSSESSGTSSYNSNFPYYSGDCQNFASQCVWYGGGGTNTTTAINNHDSPMTTTWYCSTNGTCTSSWNSVTNFKSALYNNYVNGTLGPKGIRWSGVIAAEPGDLIQVRWEDGHYHVFVVTAVTGTSGYRTTSDITVCAHTTNHQDVSLSYGIGGDNLQEIYTLHVTGINN